MEPEERAQAQTQNGGCRRLGHRLEAVCINDICYTDVCQANSPLLCQEIPYKILKRGQDNLFHPSPLASWTLYQSNPKVDGSENALHVPERHGIAVI